ncbi:hypothetical protein HC031_15160 [Planosporangium thailandense]|uniref:DUF1772 domain-containing protein n=1 Tax=Planosporangium thailandense TaxID=765197 RepID=A0ABX0XYB8_9ACTN|nr:hypothetical protein [Planosporangium thailandense]NJC71042.1 hypothetical protein [Planosporangium thailandense]
MMPWAVLALWLATEVTGARMLAMFVRRDGLHDEGVASGYLVTLIANFTLGTASGIPWALHLATGVRILAWAAAVQLLFTTLIGTVLAVPWHRAHRRGRPTPEAGGPPAWTYPRLAESGHGLLAWATTALAFTVAVIG